MRESSSVASASVRWKIDGSTNDGSNALLLSAISTDGTPFPPYHLLGILKESSSTTIGRYKINANGDVRTTNESNDVSDDIVARLDKWSHGWDLTKTLRDIPVGSRINVNPNSTGADFAWIAPNRELESRYLSIRRLRGLWEDLSIDYPQAIDLQRLRSVSRLHDSVSIVCLPDGKHAIFKGAVMILSRMYHELRELLQMPTHPNVLARPEFVVTRKVSGSTSPAVCGFILEYHEGGTVLNAISQVSANSASIPLDEKVRWIRQIIQALHHIHGPGKTFYSDLRLDNLVLSQSRDIILVDFEQFGSPLRWLHPWVRQMADVSRDDSWMTSAVNPAVMPQSIFYSNPPAGYFGPFANSSDEMRQTFEIYTLAKVVWCIFEEQTYEVSFLDKIPQKPEDGIILFPQFVKTPPRLRYWIWLCTRSSSEWGPLQCKCQLGESDVCGQVGVKSQTAGPEMLSVKDAEDHFETAMRQELSNG